jgi:hypothetical protein
MKISQILLPLILSVLSISCKNESEDIFIREWQSKKIIIPHKAYLKINSDHTFEYRDAGCQWRCNSFGKWKVMNDTLILNSIPSKECQFTNGFGNNFRAPIKGEDFKLETTIKDCKPDERNGEYVKFINDKFYIKNDTLEYVTNIKLPFNNRFAFFKRQ